MEEKKKTNKRIVFSIIVVLLLVAVVAGATYAYFSATASTDTQTVTTGTLTMGFTNGDLIRATGITPISDSEIKTKAVELPFSVTNTGNQHMKLTIKLTDIVISDALKDIDFRWGLYNADTDVGLSFGFFKNIGTSTEEIIYRDTIIDASDPDITKNYKLRIWIHDDGALQNELQGQEFSAKIKVDGEVVEYTPESCFTICTQELKNQDVCYDIGSIIDYDVTTCGTDVVIPKTIGSFTKTRLYANSFSNKGLTSVIIPNTIQSLYWQATESGVFENNELMHITIPESVTEIAPYAFYKNNLQSIFISDNITEPLESSSFEESGNINSIVLTSNEIRYNAFSNLNLSSLVLQDGVTTIGSNAFSNNQLTSIEIPSSVTYVDSGAFSNNSNLTEIVVRGKSSLSDFDNATGLSELSDVNIVFRP